jgi:hypothetical protein
VTLQRKCQHRRRWRRRKVANIKFITAVLAVIAHVDAPRNISEPAVAATASEQLIHDTLEVDVVEFYFGTFRYLLPLTLFLFVLLLLFSFVTFTARTVTTARAISAVRHGKK